jgi:hypothetical protein
MRWRKHFLDVGAKCNSRTSSIKNKKKVETQLDDYEIMKANKHNGTKKVSKTPSKNLETTY